MGWFKRIIGREGNVKWIKEFHELEAFFSSFSDVLEDFAAAHNLMIEKYGHHSPKWALKFKHPKGGIGRIEVKKNDDLHIIIRGSWWIDDYEESTRFLKYQKGEEYCLDNLELRSLLEKKFHEIISWEKESLTPLRSRHIQWKKRTTKEQFEKNSYEKYPIPKFD